MTEQISIFSHVPSGFLISPLAMLRLPHENLFPIDDVAHRHQSSGFVSGTAMRIMLLFATGLSLLFGMADSTHARSFTVLEVQPLLRALSKLDAVRITSSSPYLNMDWPHLCWLDSARFRPLTAALSRYPGAGSWYVISDLPRLCLFAQPNLRQSESPLLDNEDFTKKMVEEMPKLAAFLQKELGLEEKPELGVHVVEEALELPLIEDHSGPGGGVLLVADPAEFAKTRLATSSFDRALHFWITTEEANELYHATHGINGGRESDWLLLAEIAEPYNPVAVAPSMVGKLAAECKKLADATVSTKLRNALDRILSVCRSASNYKLGIYIPSP